MQKIDLQNTKTVDVHCHPFIPNKKPYSIEEFLDVLSLSVSPDMFKQNNLKPNNANIYSGMNMYMQLMIRNLAEYYACAPTLENVLDKRNEAAQDFSSYVKKLFKDANLEGMIVDYGYPMPQIPQDEFESNIGFKTLEVYRIEPAMDSLRKNFMSFEDFIDGYRSKLKFELEKKHVVGLKSIIAYRSGLDIKSKNFEKAKQQFTDYRKDKTLFVKELRDYCMHIAMEECTKSKKVMHIHTGVGDGDILLQKSSPKFLIDLLRMYEETKVHLVHGGYPWIEEAGFIVSILPNVYMDISLQNPFSGHGVKRILSQVFEFAPFDKVMFGSDSFTVPEMNWLAAKLFKNDFTELLKEWVTKGYMEGHMAQEIGEMVLYKNFERIYGEI